MSKQYRAAIVGASGFLGAELLRRLLEHPSVEVVRVGAADHVGEPVSSALPHLEGLTELTFEDRPAAELAEGCDILLMGLPHAASAAAVHALRGKDLRILDLSGAFRLQSAEVYARTYGATHPAPELLREFVYGLPELNRERLRGARFVASPGCFATCVELGLLPLARAGLLTGTVRTVGITGSSGAGATPVATTHHPVRANNLRTYKPLEHPHHPEILATLCAAGARELSLEFVPVSAPLVRGIFATSFVTTRRHVPLDALRLLYVEACAGERFLRMPAKRLPEVVAVAGSNSVELGVTAPEGESANAVCFSALDNLVKGGAGQAIQNLNLMLGLDEHLTLTGAGAYP